jgi:hypothetical protein
MMREGADFGWRALVGWIHSYGMRHHTTRDLYRPTPDGVGALFTKLGKCDRNDAMKAFITAEDIQVVAEHGLTDHLTKIHRMPGEIAYRVAHNAVSHSPEREAPYRPGGRPGVLDVAELESDLGMPGIASTSAVVWEIHDRFGVRTPIEGYGRLLLEFRSNVEASGRG